MDDDFLDDGLLGDSEFVDQFDDFVAQIQSQVIENQIYVDVNALMYLFNEYYQAIQDMLEQGVDTEEPIVQGQAMVMAGMFVMHKAFMKKHIEEIRLVDPETIDKEIEDLLDGK